MAFLSAIVPIGPYSRPTSEELAWHPAPHVVAELAEAHLTRAYTEAFKRDNRQVVFRFRTTPRNLLLRANSVANWRLN